MARIDTRMTQWSAVAISTIERSRSVGLCALGVVTACMMTVPSASADPAPPPTGDDVATQVAAADPAPTPAGVPHLASPDNLPPGTTNAPLGPPQRRMDYLRDVWHVIQTEGVGMDDALLLLTQRPLDPDTVPPPGLPAGPQQPLVG